MKQVIVIGGGPSGMMAAIAAAGAGAAATLIEAGPKPGRKLLLTGNGRCNLTNLDDGILSVYRSSDMEKASELVRSVFDRFNVGDTISFFRKEGLLTCAEHGSYVYPASGQSSSVLNVLLRAMNSLKIKQKYNEEVTAIERCDEDKVSESSGARWTVRTKTWAYRADCVIICCGSRCVPSTGSNGAGYELCRMLGLDVTDILPGLTAVSCSLPEPDTKAYVPGSGKYGSSLSAGIRAEDPLFAASGTRTQAEVSVLSDGEVIACERGQLQFTQHDISGIVVFNLSRNVARAMHSGHHVELSLDLVPDYTIEEIQELMRSLRGRFTDTGYEKLLEGIIPSRLIPAVMAASVLSGSDPASVVKDFRLRAHKLRGFDSAQVCLGGVPASELEPETLECTADELKGIYLAGEIIDIDGPCGGYNLQWAWSSGYVAGVSAAGTEE